MNAFWARWMAAGRLAIAVLTALGLSLAFNWPRPEWAAIACIVMNLPFLGASIERGLTRFLGTVTGACLGMWMVGSFAENQPMFLVVVFVIAVVCMYLGQGSFYPYSFMLCIVTALIVALPAMNDGELAPANVWNYALYRTLETGLGIVVSLVVNAVLWPNYAGPKLRALMDGAMRTCDQLLAAYLGDQFAARPSAGALDELARETNGALIGSGPLLHFALRDTKAVGRRQAAYEAALNHCVNCSGRFPNCMRAGRRFHSAARPR
jgi:uncharacterized membrane protein YccC